jgi:hypothetical protein
MAVNPTSLKNLTPWRPGQSGHPGGKPTAARARLTAKFLYDLAEDYDTNGKTAIQTLRTEDPAAYVRVVAALCPRDPEREDALDGLDNDTLGVLIMIAQRYSESRRARMLQQTIDAVESGVAESP